MSNDVSGSFNHICSFDGSNWNGDFQSGWVNDIACDNVGNVYCTRGSNLNKWNGLSWQSFSPVAYSLSWWASPVCADEQGKVWISNNGSVLTFDGADWAELNTVNSSLPSMSISEIRAGNGKVYFASDSGLVVYDSNLWEVYNTSNSALPDNAIESMAIANGQVWMTTQSGYLVHFDGTTFISYASTILSGATEIVIDYNDIVWISTMGDGILRFENGVFDQFTISINPILDPYDQYRSIAVDLQNQVWIGSQSAGLIMLNQEPLPPVPLQDTTKIFFLGNSFTASNGLPWIVESLADNAQQAVYVLEHAPGGQFCTDHCVNPAVYDMLRSTDWDYVVIQDNQGAFVNIPPYIGTDYFDANMQLLDSIKSYNSCSHVIWFAGWGIEGGWPQYFPNDSTEYCIERILDNVVYLNSFANEVVGPIGEGWLRSLAEQPNIDLYSADGAHPSEEGSYLTAAVLYSLIFKDDPSGLSYVGGLSATDAQYLRTVGYDVVEEYSHQVEYGINSITPYIEMDTSWLFSTQSFQAYQWFYDYDVLPGAQNPELELGNDGMYALWVNDFNGCLLKSFYEPFGQLPEVLFAYSQFGANVAFINLSGNYDSLIWDFGDGNLSSLTDPSHTYAQSGVYTVVLEAFNLYGSEIYADSVSIMLNISMDQSENLVEVFPNPVLSELSVHNYSTVPITRIELFDLTGRQVRNESVKIRPEESYRMDVQILVKGMYQIRLYSEEGSSEYRIVKQ